MVKAKWSFVFPDNHIAIEVIDPVEDQRIEAGLDKPAELLYIPGSGKDIYVNLGQMRFALREEIEEPAVPVEDKSSKDLSVEYTEAEVIPIENV